MAKVENPRFDLTADGMCWCHDCPLDGNSCGDWVVEYGRCPTAENYQDACRMAEEATHDAP